VPPTTQGTVPRKTLQIGHASREIHLFFGRKDQQSKATMNGQPGPLPTSGFLQDVLKHPLQRLHSPSRTFSLILHAVGLCSFANSFHYLQTHPNPINQSYGWHFQYLTILGISRMRWPSDSLQVSFFPRSRLPSDSPLMSLVRKLCFL